MALNPKLSNEAANAEADAVGDLLDYGYLRIYNGSQPANADASVGGATLLAELRFNATAFGSASAGVATAGAFTQDSSANATGTAAWFRALKSDGSSPIFDGTVGTSGANLNLNSVSIVSGVAVQVTGFTFTASKG